MSDTDNLKTFYGLMMKPRAKDEQLAKIRKRQKRERKKKS